MKKRNDISLFSMLHDTIRQHALSGSERTAETYQATYNSFFRFTGGKDVPIDGFDASLVRQYECWLKSRGVSPNTIAFYMKHLRAVYRQAVDRGLDVAQDPFRTVFLGKAKTAKRAVKLAVIRKVKSLDLTDSPSLALARDLFMFSFYTRGMSFVDICYLRRSNLQDGYLVYRRHKTGQLLRIRLERCMLEILARYAAPEPSAASPASDYLFPIITEAGQGRQQYRRMQYRVNYSLAQLSKLAGIRPKLTMYVARHSWASIARDKNVAMSVISEGLGHQSERTTRIYLAELDESRIDKANKLILDDL